MALIYLLNLERKTSSNCMDKWKTVHFPMGLSLIASALTPLNHRIKILDNYPPNHDLKSILQEVEKKQPEFLLLTAFLGNHQYGFLKEVSYHLRRLCPKATQIMGGPMATTIPDLILKNFAVDYVVIGEGEETILDLINAVENGHHPKKVKGIGFLDENEIIIITEKRPRIKDFSRVPLPPYELFDMGYYVDYLKQTGRCWEISGSRGCIGRCTFCKLTFGKELSLRPINNIIEEMSYIKKQYGIDRFNFVDDNFLNSAKKVDEFIFALKSCQENFRFRFQGRVDMINGRLTKKLREAGCFGISFGLESGSEKVLANIRKRFNLKKAEENLKEILDMGIEVHSTFIVGTPAEDESSIEETKQFINRVGLPNVAAGILTPFPGTEVYEWARQRGLLPDEEKYCENLGVVYESVYLNLTDFPDETLMAWRKEINNIGK